MIPENVTYRPIGVIHSEHQNPEETPVQPAFAAECRGRAEIKPEYVEGLKDLEGFSHLILLYHLHRAEPAVLIVKPFTGEREHGIFATRHPRRPNPIGLSVVRLLGVVGGTLELAGVDILDGTPLLDVKPWVPRFDLVEAARGGWNAEIPAETVRHRGRRGYRGDREESE